MTVLKPQTEEQNNKTKRNVQQRGKKETCITSNSLDIILDALLPAWFVYKAAWQFDMTVFVLAEEDSAMISTKRDLPCSSSQDAKCMKLMTYSDLAGNN